MRSSTHRTKKYAAKLSGKIQQLQLERYGKMQRTIFKGSVGKQVEVERQVKAYLAGEGISTMDTNYYILFAKNVLKKRTQEADIEFNKWAGRNLSWYHLRNIGRMFFHRRLNLWNKDNQPATALYLPFSQGSGLIAYDKSRNDNHGALEPDAGSITDESFTSVFDTPVQLDHTDITGGTVVVTDDPSNGPFTEGVDYTINYVNGTITVLSTGGMLNATGYLIDYDYSTSVPDWVTGILGNALDFDGIDDYVRVPSDASLFTTKAVTWMVWIYCDTITTRHHMIAVGGAVKARSYVDANGAVVVEDFGHANNDLNSGNGEITTGRWYLVAITYDANVSGVSNAFIYKDGEIIADIEWIDDMTISGNLDIGSSLGTSYFFDGKIDEVRIFPSALTQTEIRNIYHAEKPF